MNGYRASLMTGFVVAVAACWWGGASWRGTEAIAEPVTYDFTANVTTGKLAGMSSSGSFTYDDDKVNAEGITAIGVEDGLVVDMIFFERSFSAEDDIDYPAFPQLVFENGELQKLDFWVEPGGPRNSWWTLPGWEIQLQRRQAEPQP